MLSPVSVTRSGSQAYASIMRQTNRFSSGTIATQKDPSGQRGSISTQSFFPRLRQNVRQSMDLSLLQILTTAAFTCAVQLDNHWKTCVHPLRHPDGIGKARICQPMILYVHFVSSALSQMTFADAISCQKIARVACPSAFSSQQQSRTGSSSSSIRSSRPSA